MDTSFKDASKLSKNIYGKLMVQFLQFFHVSNKIIHHYTITPYNLEIISIEFQLKLICSQKIQHETLTNLWNLGFPTKFLNGKYFGP